MRPDWQTSEKIKEFTRGAGVIWIIALIWRARMMLNACRCNRTHCRYTGPYSLAMTVPVMALGTGVVSIGILGWVCLGVILLGGIGLIWWATENAHGGISLSVESRTMFTCAGSAQGPNSEVQSRSRKVSFAPMKNGHRQTGPTGPFRVHSGHDA